MLEADHDFMSYLTNSFKIINTFSIYIFFSSLFGIHLITLLYCTYVYHYLIHRYVSSVWGF